MYTPVSTAVFLNSVWWLASQHFLKNKKSLILTDFDLLIRILHIVSVQPKFEILVFFAIEPWSESWRSGLQICLIGGHRITMESRMVVYKLTKKHPK